MISMRGSLQNTYAENDILYLILADPSLFIIEVSFGMYNCNPVLCNCLVWLSCVYLKYVVYWQEWSKETTDLAPFTAAICQPVSSVHATICGDAN